MNSKKLTIIKWIFEIVLIIILSFMYYLNKPIKTSKVMYVPRGSINKIIAQLQRENYDVFKLDSILLRIIGRPQNGWINLGNKESAKADFLYKLTTAKAALQNITLIPGETTYIFLNKLAKKLKLNRAILQKNYDYYFHIKEGALVPNTYRLPIGITEQKLIKILHKQSLNQMRAFSIKLFGTYNETKWFRYVIIASIIQKESADISEMPIVSSVIYNRIKKGMYLQMDGTLNYGKYSHMKVTSKRIREDTTSFNTYKHKGIPNMPVCNVSFDAIRASVFPAKTNYLYFMKSKNKKHDFACNYSTHLSNIRRATK